MNFENLLYIHCTLADIPLQYIKGGCIPWEIEEIGLLRGLSPYLHPRMNLPLSQWTQMMLGVLLKKFIEE